MEMVMLSITISKFTQLSYSILIMSKIPKFINNQRLLTAVKDYSLRIIALISMMIHQR